VRAGRADLGVVLDGDGDRILFVDERGEPIENYFLSALIAEELLSRQPGAAIVYDLISSRALPERVRELGGRPAVSRVGYTFVYDKMVETGAVFGAETSGHVYFKVSDTYYTESAAYALAVLLRLLARKGRPLSELVAPLQGRYAQSPETNIEVPDRHKEEALRRVRQRYAGGRIDTLDGVSVEYPDFWFNVRPSNTEPLIRLRLEGVDRGAVEARTREILDLLADLQE
jgi:phosphomannomutase